MAFAGEAPKLDRNEYPLELKKILRILEKRDTEITRSHMARLT